MKEEKKENEKQNGEFREKVSVKGIVIRSVLSFLFAGALFALMFCVEHFGALQITWPDFKYRLLSDSFFVGGAFPILFWLLLWVNEKGAFDLIVYSVRKFVGYIVHANPDKSKLPPTYADYAEMKQGNRKPLHYELLIVGVTFLLLGGLFAFISYGNDVAGW